MNSEDKILITGANGFVGSALLAHFDSSGMDVRCVYRKSIGYSSQKVDYVCVEDLSQKTDWSAALDSVAVVVHCAARAHVLKEYAPDPAIEFFKTNCDGTLQLARQAAKTGVKRFVYLSSIGVNGVSSNKPFTEDDLPNPSTDYARSKWEAEKGLKQIESQTDMQIVIIRPPLVYGPRAPGNLNRLLFLIKKGIPLPLSSVHNKRSFVSIRNLVDFITICISHPNAGGETFLVSDGHDLSTIEFINLFAKEMGRKVCFFPFSPWVLKAGLKMIGKTQAYNSLCTSLQVDIRKSKTILGWKPCADIDDEVRKIVHYFLRSQSR